MMSHQPGKHGRGPRLVVGAEAPAFSDTWTAPAAKRCVVPKKRALKQISGGCNGYKAYAQPPLDVSSPLPVGTRLPWAPLWEPSPAAVRESAAEHVQEASSLTDAVDACLQRAAVLRSYPEWDEECEEFAALLAPSCSSASAPPQQQRQQRSCPSSSGARASKIDQQSPPSSIQEVVLLRGAKFRHAGCQLYRLGRD